MLWFWGAVTALALIVEFITADLITIWFAAGGLVTLLVVALAPGLSIIWQCVIFVLVSVGLLLCTRRICLRLLRKGGVKTNIEALIGNVFEVKNVDEQGFTYHKINGVEWRVYPIAGEQLEVNSQYEICEVKGNKLIAKKINKNKE